MHYITAAPPARGEGGTEGRGASGQASTFIPVFLLTLAASVPGVGGFRGAGKQGLEAGRGLPSWRDPRARAGGQTASLSPWLGGAWEAGSLSAAHSVIALPCDLGQVPPPPTPALCSVYICVENSWPLESLGTLLKKDALGSCCAPGHSIPEGQIRRSTALTSLCSNDSSRNWESKPGSYGPWGDVVGNKSHWVIQEWVMK